MALVRNALKLIGYDPLITLTALYGVFFYVRDYRRFKKQLHNDTAFPFGKMRPIFNERHAQAGIARGHYFYQDLFVAQRIFLNNPQKHIDIGSRVDGFVAHVAVFRKIEVMDIRHQAGITPNIIFRRVDLMNLPMLMTKVIYTKIFPYTTM